LKMPNNDQDKNFIELVNGSSNLINFDASVTKDDIIAIALSEWESRLRTEVKAFDKEYRDRRIVIKGIEKEIENFRERHEQTYKRDEIDAIKDSLSAFGWCPEMRVTVEYPEGSITGTVSISFHSGNYTSHFTTYRQTFNLNENIILKHKEIAALQNLQEVCSTELNRLRGELHNVNAKEREARAGLARQVLGSSEAGAHLLQKLQENA